ncbi:SIMPL domain-containing protein [Nannocystis radixulma]|uniref:SIMPL domain-containing protein n=1 Tax=Nannocystis radixulma TaxID=2995305 RepID=A0ABT5BNZ5_9BACT|nr:SIMPL domain-containing protein [Nannocystis radixulma]MDC0675889.1 SIMPL domain-containing protein [Nannocystis radixulma]
MEPSKHPVPLDLRPFGLLGVGVALVLATYIASSTWERVRVRPVVRTIQVTGSAKKRIVSDFIEWTATVEANAADRTATYRVLHDNATRTQEFLVKRGVPKDQIWLSSASVEPSYETEYHGTGDNRVEKQVMKGFDGVQEIKVRSNDVALVEKMSREVTELLEEGVTVSSDAPEYFYTKLGDVKIEMLAEASRDARTRADNIVASAGGAEIGELRTADMGVINVNPANSTEGSWDGNNDTSSLEKDIITIVHATFELK